MLCSTLIQADQGEDEREGRRSAQFQQYFRYEKKRQYMFECAECFIYFIVYDFIESYFLKQLIWGNTG